MCFYFSLWFKFKDLVVLGLVLPPVSSNTSMWTRVDLSPGESSLCCESSAKRSVGESFYVFSSHLVFCCRSGGSEDPVLLFLMQLVFRKKGRRGQSVCPCFVARQIQSFTFLTSDISVSSPLSPPSTEPPVTPQRLGPRPPILYALCSLLTPPPPTPALFFFLLSTPLIVFLPRHSYLWAIIGQNM